MSPAASPIPTATPTATAPFVYRCTGNRVKTTVGGVMTTYIGSHCEWTGSSGVTHPDVVSNGDTQANSSASTSREYAYSNANGLQYVQVDLGVQFPVNKVSVWHYNGDGRSYHNTKSVSCGCTWRNPTSSTLIQGLYFNC